MVVYAAVRALLDAAEYQHAFHAQDGGEVIDMHGIALRSKGGAPETEITVKHKPVETIEHLGECTRLHVIDSGGAFQVWLDTDIGTEDGICIGLGITREQALEDAFEELKARVVDLQDAVSK